MSHGGGRIQNNCFYCAACSGWFLIQHNSRPSAHSKYLLSKMGSVGEDRDRKEAGLPTTPSNLKFSQPQFVMQHIPDKSNSSSTNDSKMNKIPPPRGRPSNLMMDQLS